MLNLECQTVYDVIRAIAGADDVYKVVEAEEIIAHLPQGVSLSKVQLSAVIRELKERAYIVVKYFTPDEYCLMVVKRIEEPQKQQGAVAQDEGKSERKERALSDRKKGKDVAPKSVSKGVIFLTTFFASMLGSAIIAAIALVVAKFMF